jgi:hypothetical protein
MSGKRVGNAAKLLVAIATTALTASPVASAKPGFTIVPPRRSSQLTVRGTHGFGITIRRIAGHVELSAEQRIVSATYTVRRERGPLDGIKATFPGLGSVSVRFHPSGRPKRGPAFCKGRRPLTQYGVFRGVIRFEGERGFTQIARQNARGFVYRSFKEACSSSRNSGGFPFYSLAESARSGGRLTAFNALRGIDENAILDSALYSAFRSERRHGMTSVRFAIVSAGLDTFTIAGSPDRPESATVAPPPPFSGTATFQASPGTLAKWEGTLAVDLPGIETVSLIGPQFRPVLCRERRCLGKPDRGESASPVTQFLRSRPSAWPLGRTLLSFHPHHQPPVHESGLFAGKSHPRGLPRRQGRPASGGAY